MSYVLHEAINLVQKGLLLIRRAMWPGHWCSCHIWNKFWVLPNQQPVGNENNMHHESISLTILEHSKWAWSEQLFTMHRICVLVALCLYAAYGYESCDQKIMEDTICSLCGQRKGSEQQEAGIGCQFQSTILCRSIFRKQLFFYTYTNV